MKTRLLLLGITWATALLTAEVAKGFSINAVTLSPSNIVAPTMELQMTIEVLTPSQAARLYAPTQISSNSAGIRVDIYPTGGMLTAIGVLHETVVLGTFPAGTYNYEVQIHPNYQANWGVRTNRGSFTVRDDRAPPALPTVSISGPSTVLEFCPPNADCVGINFYLRRTGPGLEQPLTVFIQYRGTAVADSDYAALPAPVTFEAGRDLVNVFSNPIDDTLYEGDETIIAQVLPLMTYDVDPNHWQATTVIRDNEPPAPPLVSLELVDPVAMETLPYQNFAKWAEFRVVRTGPATNELVVFLDPRHGSATFGEDYWLDRVTNGTVRLHDGARSVNVRLYVIDDAVYEGDETAFPQLMPPPLGTPLSELYTVDNAHSSVALVVRDNDQPEPPTVWIETIEPATSEPYPSGLVVPGKFLIFRTGSLEGHLLVFLQYGGTASNSVDYRELPRWFVEIPAGSPSAVVDIVALADTLVEGKETVEVTVLPEPPDDFPLLIPIQEYRVDTNRLFGRVIIFDRQTPFVLPTVSIEATAPEARECGPNQNCPIARGRLTLRRTGELDYPLRLYVGLEGTAGRGGDYRLLLPDPSQQGFSYFVTLPAGQRQWDVIIDPIDDVLAEDDETATLRLLQVAIDTSQFFPPADYGVASDHVSATVIIHDNDPFGLPVISLELVDPEAEETLIHQNNIDWAEFRVLRTGSVTNELMVFLNTRQGTARLGEDYQLDGAADGSTVRFLANARSVNVRLYPIDDDFYEGDETVFFHLIAPPSGSHPYEVEYAHSSVAMDIHDNDPVTTRLNIVSPLHGQHFEAGEVIRLQAQVIGPGSSNAWTVEFFDGEQKIGTTHPGGAVFWSNANGGPHVVHASASASTGPALTARPATIQVGPGPAWPVVSITAERGQTGEPCPTCRFAPGVFTFTRNGPTDGPLTVYVHIDGTATPGEDYQALPSSVTIPAGTNSTQVLVLPFDDSLVEGPEVVHASIARPPELATLGYIVNVYASEAFVVINDDEAGAPEARLDILEPKNGAHFAVGTSIQLSALGVYTAGEVASPVEFYAGNVYLGRSTPHQPGGRPFIPGLPSIHTFLWTNPPAGRHVLMARSELSLNQFVQSPPVPIMVGPESAHTAVRIEATQPIAEEDSNPLDRLPLTGLFTISRTGPTNDPLLVYVQYSGTATSGEDYPALPQAVIIPAGATSTEMRVVPIPDQLPEPVETLIAAISDCPPMCPECPLPPCYGFVIDATHARATIFIRDDGVARVDLEPGPRLTSPTLGTNGVVQFLILGGSWGQANVVEVSTDLVNWSPISTNVFPPTLCPICPFIEFKDPASTNQTRRFYRALNR